MLNLVIANGMRQAGCIMSFLLGSLKKDFVEKVEINQRVQRKRGEQDGCKSREGAQLFWGRDPAGCIVGLDVVCTPFTKPHFRHGSSLILSQSQSCFICVPGTFSHTL